MNEIEKLCKLLDKAGMKYECENLFDGKQVKLFCGDHLVDDAVWHTMSHGYEQGLLETYNLSCCHGYETAEEIFNGWKRLMEEMY